MTQLEHAYLLNGFDVGADVSKRDLESILESYMLLFASESDSTQDKAKHQADKANIHVLFSKFPQLQTLSGDAVRNMAWLKSHTASPFKESSYSFSEATAVVSDVVQQYGKARDVQCHELKDGLMEMDHRRSGRVLLKNFYGKKKIGPWILSESPEYLRQLGALDESMPSLGPQLIITNYVTSISNCDSPSEYYSMCCIHECEEILNAFEASIGVPSAEPQVILGLTANMSTETVETP